MSDYFLKNTGINHSKIPSVLFALRKSKQLSLSQAYLALDLADYCHNEETEHFSISFKEMKERTGLNERTLQDGIKKLLELGVILHVAQKAPQFKNQYTWNLGFLSIGRKNLLRGVSKKHYGGLVKNTKGPQYFLLSLYIEGFYNSFINSFISFFEELDHEGKPAGYTFRNFTKKTGEPKTKNVPRLDAWENAFKSVLKSDLPDPLVRLFIFIQSNPEMNQIRFPTSFIKSELADSAKIHIYKQSKGFPDYLESDEALIKKINEDPKFQKYLTLSPKWERGENERHFDEVH